ncbi:MAG: N-acetylglucosamine-6-phosphate deacetylase [Deltaproteobacteria bacterium]|nr:N-acetylglucosamine-6-phosphate deacetylase [Deltaproteobacteria bacterium]
MNADLRVDIPLLNDGSSAETAVSLLIEQGLVVWRGPTSDSPPSTCEARVLDSQHCVVPGFVDIHVHGAQGVDVTDDAADALVAVGAAHLVQGTTAWCPTIVSCATERMLATLERVGRARAVRSAGLPRVLGAHLEGPFLNPDRRGAHPMTALRAPDIALAKELLAAAGGALALLTIAPELPGAMAVIELMHDAGVVVSIGHSQATYQQTLDAFAAGCRSVTHLFNAMSAFHHRHPGVMGAAIDCDDVWCELIADGVHVAWPMVRLLCRAKPTERIALITDCTAAWGAASASLGEQTITARDGAARLNDGTLAGSTLTMDRALRGVVEHGAMSLTQAVYSASVAPCALLAGELIGAVRPLSVGAPADLVVLDAQRQVVDVMLAGRWIGTDRR